MNPVLTSRIDRKIYFFKVTLYCTIGLAFLFTLSNYSLQRYEVSLYNFTFGVLLSLILFFRKKNFNGTLIITGILYQAFFFGHAYYIIPGKYMEDALGVMMAIAPIFVSSRKMEYAMWYFVVTNTLLFHLVFLTVGYGEVFYFKYFFYIVLFIVIRTITRINENYEKELVIQRDKITRDAAELKELDELKTRFFANISHELRTPLTLVLSPLDSILKSKELSDRNFTYIQLVQQNAQKLLKRINELLELSRLDAKRLAVNLEPTSIFQFTQQITALHEGAADLKGIPLNYKNTIPESEQLLLDRAKLEMILSNYLSNAIKFTLANGAIAVRVRKENASLFISVADTGIGIDASEKDKIFDRFYQAKNKSYSGGSGIGLSLCKELAELQGGKVWVESELGKGSIFYVKLPYQEALVASEVPFQMERRDAAPINAKVEDQQQHLPSILIVEDNYDLRQYMKVLLSEKYNVIAAKNGRIALERLKECLITHRLPSAIISDIMMPGMDGMELLQILKEEDDFRHIPVIMLTAQNSAEVKIKALRIGVDDYLTKPFNELELLARVGNLISNSQNRHSLEDSEAVENTLLVSTISKTDLKWLEKVEQIIIEKIADPKFTLKDGAAHVNMSYNGFQQKIKKITGLTPKQYQRAIKLNKARQILKSGEVETVSEVLFQLGFDNHYYFSKIYQQEFGIMPSEELK